ncbi:Uu.00g121580.m01.CDS01 [Anthostomella pinea]|uniref:Uu.00g121580.m01.CDS01 n=1 Tax=Anthostomella pinea TaxID=933095 RepID=A0AAI8VI20_9PEZI|nr:Uu.00g121580.m01.CDS01 [Anthostomella pinea]
MSPDKNNWDDVLSLVEQVQQYLTQLEPIMGPRINKDKAIVFIWIGLNDMGQYRKLNGKDFLETAERVNTPIFTEAIQPMYEKGFKNFVLFNLQPLDQSPSNQERKGKVESPSPTPEKIKDVNKMLDGLKKEYNKKLKDAKIELYDVNSLLTKMTKNPAKYGFTNTKGPDQQFRTQAFNPDSSTNLELLRSYYWWDKVHLTSRVHQYIAEDVRSFIATKWGTKVWEKPALTEDKAVTGSKFYRA